MAERFMKVTSFLMMEKEIKSDQVNKMYIESVQLKKFQKL